MSQSIEMFGEDNVRFLVTLIKNELLKYYDKTGVDAAINDALSLATGITFKKVDALPTEESEVDKGAIYMVPVDYQSSDNKFKEYFWDDTEKRFEYFGETQADLTGYLKSSDVTKMQNSQIQTIWDSVFLSAVIEGSE